MKVLFAVSEAAPIVKLGGLGDVGGSLPIALARLGVDVSVVLPFYDLVDRKEYKPEKVCEFKTQFAGKNEPTVIYETFLPRPRSHRHSEERSDEESPLGRKGVLRSAQDDKRGDKVPVFLIENKKYLSGGGKDAFTGLEGEINRFAFFSKAIQQWLIGSAGELKFDVVHCQDWHTGLIPHLLRDSMGDERPATVLTIHNLGYQGVWKPDILDDVGLPASRSKLLQWDVKDGDVNFIMQGIVTADVINAVSPTYAREILTPEYGHGLEKILKAREARIFGILNGIDYEKFDPKTDKALVKNYGPHLRRHPERSPAERGKAKDPLKTEGDSSVGKLPQNDELFEAKRANKEYLKKKVGLVSGDGPLLAFIGRLDPGQKGLDIFYDALEKLLVDTVAATHGSPKEKAGPAAARAGHVPRLQFQFILLGTGDPHWERQFKKLAEEYPGRFAAVIKFDSELARQIYAGADMLVVPSRYEPCGLIQMIAMRYGTVPIVRKTGGLADSVEDGVTGFQFKKYSAAALSETIEKSISRYENRTSWQKMVIGAMSQDFTWTASAEKYVELYRKALEFRKSLAMTKAFADDAPVRDGGQFRSDPLSDDWTVLAAKRAKRPQPKSAKGDRPLARAGRPLAEKKINPFAEGNEKMTPPEVFRIGGGEVDGPGWEVRVVPNKFPITDYHEVIIHSPDSEKDIADLPPAQVEKILRAYKARYTYYENQREDFYIHLFNNTGSESGASLKHPHSQVVIFNRLPEMVLEEVQQARKFYSKNKVCVYCGYIEKELKYRKRVVKKTKHFTVLAPFASAWPYQLLIVPLKHRLSFSGVMPEEAEDLAKLLKGVTKALTMGFPEPSYNFWIHSIPAFGIWSDVAEYYHWHIEFVPRLKKLGGVELGAGIMVDDKASPEDAAKFYKKMYRS